LLANLKERAEYDGRPLSQYINIVLKRYIENVEKREAEKQN